MKYKVLKDFTGAERGIHVRHFVKGDVVEFGCDDLRDIAVAEKWVAADKPKGKAKTKARTKAHAAPTLRNK